ncbi:MAG: hypothetical protein ACM3X0_11545 [Bacteroidota bacterium]
MSRSAAFLTISLSAAMLTLAVAGSALAQSRDVKISGVGVRKCAEWNQWKESKSGEARAMTAEWAQGLVSGHNMYGRAGKDGVNTVVVDSTLLLPLLDAYCQKNPEQRIFVGLADIIQNLGGTKLNLTPKPATQDAPRPERKAERES